MSDSEFDELSAGTPFAVGNTTTFQKVKSGE
jgi:hypothetical protein